MDSQGDYDEGQAEYLKLHKRRKRNEESEDSLQICGAVTIFYC
jgi:hypothetical protein